jgi:hypothetical protein
MAKLTAKMRKALRPSQFALPEQRKYPLDTKARARNAPARASQHATPAEQATIARKVAAKFPGIKQRAGKRMMKSR